MSMLEGGWSRRYTGEAFPLLLEEQEEERVAAIVKATADIVIA